MFLLWGPRGPQKRPFLGTPFCAFSLSAKKNPRSGFFLRAAANEPQRGRRPRAFARRNEKKKRKKNPAEPDFFFRAAKKKHGAMLRGFFIFLFFFFARRRSRRYLTYIYGAHDEPSRPRSGLVFRKTPFFSRTFCHFLQFQLNLMSNQLKREKK